MCKNAYDATRWKESLLLLQQQQKMLPEKYGNKP
jgi:hypothetical protein